VYPVIALPLSAGAVHETDACCSPAVAVMSAGAAGAVGGSGTTAFEGDDAEPLPAPLVAVTVNVYEVPAVRPVTNAAVRVPSTVAVALPGDAVTVYAVIALPPSAGAVHVTDAEFGPAVAVTPVGAAGRSAGTIAFDAADAALVPIAFVAVTVNVYDVPFVRPVTVVAVVPPSTVVVAPPGDVVTV